MKQSRTEGAATLDCFAALAMTINGGRAETLGAVGATGA